MKKLIMLSLIQALSINAFAVDFGKLIVENSKAQSQLHQQIQKNVTDTQVAVQNLNKNYIADNNTEYHVKTNKDFLTFSKEKKYYKPSTAQSEKRLAQEFKDLE